MTGKLGASGLAPLPCIPAVLEQHAEDAVVVHAARTALVCASHAKLHQLGRFDERVAAHMDGLVVAEGSAQGIVGRLLEGPSLSVGFVAAVLSLVAHGRESMDRLYALAEEVPDVARGLRAAFGWVDPPQLRGWVMESPGESKEWNDTALGRRRPRGFPLFRNVSR